MVYRDIIFHRGNLDRGLPRVAYLMDGQPMAYSYTACYAAEAVRQARPTDRALSSTLHNKHKTSYQQT